MKEIKVYLVDLTKIEYNTSPRYWDDEQFITVAEEQGSVYSLEGFQNAYNNDENNQNNTLLRIINPN